MVVYTFKRGRLSPGYICLAKNVICCSSRGLLNNRYITLKLRWCEPLVNRSHIRLSLLASDIRSSITMRFWMAGFRNCSSSMFTGMPFTNSMSRMILCISAYKGCH